MNGGIYRMDCTRAWFLLGTLAQLLLHIFQSLISNQDFIILPLFNKTRTGPTLHLWLDGCGGLEILADVGAGGELYKSYCR